MSQIKLFLVTSCYLYYPAVQHALSEYARPQDYRLDYLLVKPDEASTTAIPDCPSIDRLIFLLQDVSDLVRFLRFASDISHTLYMNKERLIIIGKTNLLKLLSMCYHNIDSVLLPLDGCTMHQLGLFLDERIHPGGHSERERIKSRLSRGQMWGFISLLSGRGAKREAQDTNKSVKTLYAQRHKSLTKLNCRTHRDLYPLL
ncbi:hypothetical protein [Lonsdalea iberica]|uniref:Uncharacterized protein n=1 Tax=Lonsdalea iberica TaxID=1082703 RepID=A0A1X3RSC7_9GAMM|nr:hypothetical protein [Lonsdalea iberica]OSN04688.1 hypothetical protein AU511_11860 [Lonsdalea iberica]